jgi:hypothetical protein
VCIGTLKHGIAYQQRHQLLTTYIPSRVQRRQCEVEDVSLSSGIGRRSLHASGPADGREDTRSVSPNGSSSTLCQHSNARPFQSISQFLYRPVVHPCHLHVPAPAEEIVIFVLLIVSGQGLAF